MVTELTICDDCSLVAYDLGIGVVSEVDWDCDYEDDNALDQMEADEKSGWQAQVNLMVEMGRELPDHLCSANMEPQLDIICHCGCRAENFTGR